MNVEATRNHAREETFVGGLDSILYFVKRVNLHTLLWRLNNKFHKLLCYASVYCGILPTIYNVCSTFSLCTKTVRMSFSISYADDAVFCHADLLRDEFCKCQVH